MGKRLASIAGLVTLLVIVVAPTAQARTVGALLSPKASDGYRVRIAVSRPRLGLPSILFKHQPASAMARVEEMATADLASSSGFGRAGSGRRGDATVIVKTPRSRREEALSAYASRAAVTVRRIRSGLGRLGSMSMRFHERKKHRQRLAYFCKGRLVKRTGFFTGRLRFRGEHGYVQVAAHRVPGEVVTAQHVRCRAARAAKRLGRTNLFASSNDAIFNVNGFRRDSIMLASARSHLGRMRIAREGLRFAGPGEYEPAPDLSAAHVAPRGELFSGSADFAAPRAWTGSLVASFPGATVPMAGADFHASLGFDGIKPDSGGR